MGHVQPRGDLAGIMNILTGTARAFAPNGLAVIVKLKRDVPVRIFTMPARSPRGWTCPIMCWITNRVFATV